MSKTAYNVIAFLLVGLGFSAFLVLGSGQPLTLASMLLAEAQVFVMGALLNPFAGISFLLVAVSVFLQDTSRGVRILVGSKAWVQNFFGKMKWPLSAMALAAVLGVVIMTLNPNLWAVISVYPMAHILVFLGIRQLRDIKSR